MKITIPVSVGELIDKITILEIKSMFTDNEYVKKELDELNQIKNTITQYTLEYQIELKKVNENLWKIEDKIRKKEQLQEFVTFLADILKHPDNFVGIDRKKKERHADGSLKLPDTAEHDGLGLA